MRLRWSLVLVVLLVLSGTTVEAGRRIVGVRGTAPARWATFFSADGNFVCDGGTSTLGAARVNDDYCDCMDGTDEPGTSACAAVTSSPHFFCRNDGFESATVPPSRINDGVCDYCDGSDEWAGAATCGNTCAQSSSAAGGQPAMDIEAIARGAQVRTTYVRRAAEARAAGDMLGSSFGPDDAYFGLKGECFEIQSGVFLYRACPFAPRGEATQTERGKEGSPIKVGIWEGLDAATNTMRFTNGDACGDVKRTLTIDVSCGDTNIILREAEPSMCQYVMDMSSPAACDAAALAAANLGPDGKPVKIRTRAPPQVDSGGFLSSWFGGGGADDGGDGGGEGDNDGDDEYDIIVYHDEL